MNERIRLYYYDNSGQLVFIRFLEEIEDTKFATSKDKAIWVFFYQISIKNFIEFYCYLYFRTEFIQI